MLSRDATLLTLAEAVADGSDIDWLRAESSADGVSQLEIVQQLRLLASLGASSRATAAQWGPLQLRSEIGGGTFGTVYRAWDPRLEREVALKLLHPEPGTPSSPSTVVKEARLLAQVDRHPSVVKVYGADVFDGRVGIWMEFVTGRTLKQIIEEQGPFGAEEAALIGRDLCGALAAVHKLGFVHRDVKAQNVMREAGGRIVLMDFGAGHAAADRELRPLAGTPLYLAPELLGGATASPQSDLYSLGVLLYYLVTGQFPVTATSLSELRARHAEGSRQLLRDARPDLPDWFVRAVDQATAPMPSDRPQSAGALEALLEPGSRLASGPTSVVRPLSRRLAPTWALAAVCVLTLLALIGLALFTMQGGTTLGVVPKVAVLPILNLSGQPDWIADAFADDLMTTFTLVDGVQLAGWTSASAAARRPGASPTEIATALGVEWLIEGSVRRGESSDGVLVNLRLLDRAGSVRWSNSFSKAVRDLTTVPREAVTGVASAIGIALPVDAPVRTGLPHSQNDGARAAYLEARSLLRNDTVANYKAARGYLERAIALDSQYAMAHATLGRCLIDLQVNGLVPTSEAIPLAREHINRAIALDGRLSEPHTRLADLRLYYDRDWSGAGDSYRNAISLNPNDILARIQYSKYLAALGRVNEAVVQARTAEDLDPVSPATGNVAMMLYYARRHDESVVAFQRRLRASPGLTQVHFSIGRVYAAKGAFGDALRELRRAIEIGGGATASPLYLAELARTHAQAGDESEARLQLSTLERANPQLSANLRAYFGYVYAALGDKDKAFELLQAAVDEQAAVLMWAQVDPRLDGLRDDARYPQLLRSIALVK